MDAGYIASFQSQVDADLAFVLSGEFSEPIKLVFIEGSIQTTINTRGIFDETYQEIDPATGAIVMSRNPRVTVSEKEIQSVVHTSIEDDPADSWIVTARGKEYYISSPERDGTGLIMLRLNKI